MEYKLVARIDTPFNYYVEVYVDEIDNLRTKERKKLKKNPMEIFVLDEYKPRTKLVGYYLGDRIREIHVESDESLVCMSKWETVPTSKSWYDISYTRLGMYHPSMGRGMRIDRVYSLMKSEEERKERKEERLKKYKEKYNMDYVYKVYDTDLTKAYNNIVNPK